MIQLLRAAKGERDDARAVLTRAGAALGRAMSTWSVLPWPDVGAIVGGVAATGEALLGPVRAELHQVAPPSIGGRITVEIAELGGQAARVGALLLATADEAGVMAWARHRS